MNDTSIMLFKCGNSGYVNTSYDVSQQEIYDCGRYEGKTEQTSGASQIRAPRITKSFFWAVFFLFFVSLVKEM